VRAALDLLVYVELPEAERFARRLRRDTAERGRSPDCVRRQWDATVEPMFRLHVAPARDAADLVVPGDAPLSEAAAGLADMLRRRSHTDLTAGRPGNG
jgi:uridine kinase